MTMDQATIEAYNRYSQIYDQEVIEFWENFPKTTVDEFSKRLGGKRVINLGSGSGRDALILKNKGVEVICVDASSEMVKITRGLGFETIETDFSNYNFNESEFDGVWAYTSLLHLRKEDLKKVLKEIYKSLKPRGVFLIGMIEGFYEGKIEIENMPEEKRYFRYYEELELKKIVEEVGFKFGYQERYKPNSKIFLAQIYVK
jgi:SAM-dependent methyltransferase